MNNRPATIILYGSYGYTGKLIVRECQEKKLSVILAGRNRKALQQQSIETGFPFDVADTTDATALQKLLQKGAVVIHCGGPFQFTAKAMADACLETQTHYTDITGEFEVFEMLANYDFEAKQAGITILPGTGFDVVPSDCLAMHLKNRLPSATHLQIAFSLSGGGPSRGTAKTSIEGLGVGSTIRENGKLVSVPMGEKVLEIELGSRKTKALNIPWGDVATAWRSTGIPNIEVYMGVLDKMIQMAKLSKYVNWLLRKRWVKNYIHRQIDKKVKGPDENTLTSGKSFFWAKAWDNHGNECVSRLETINGYLLTAKTSVLIAEKILQGDFKPGYQTPAMAYGENLILEVKGTGKYQDV